MTFESCRSLGRISTLLILVTTIIAPVASVAALLLGLLDGSVSVILLSVLLATLSFTGQIMFIVAMRRFATYYKAPSIFRNVLYSFLTAIVGGIIMVTILALFLFSVLNPITTIPFTSSNVFASSFFSNFILLYVGVLLGGFVLALIQGLFYWRAFNALAEKSGEEHFKTTGLLMLIGGALTIVLVGSIVFFVGWIFAAIGFFSMRAPQQTLSPSQKVHMVGEPMQKSYCPYCGAAHQAGAVFCPNCGQKL